MNTATAIAPSSFALRARKLGRNILSLLSSLPTNQVVADERHLEITRRIYNAPMLAHNPIFTLLHADPAFSHALPQTSVPYLMRVVIGEDEIRANLYRTCSEQLQDVFDHDWHRNGELAFLVHPNAKVAPLMREEPGLYFNPYEPEISYGRSLTEVELAQVRRLTSPHLLEMAPLN